MGATLDLDEMIYAKPVTPAEPPYAILSDLHYHQWSAFSTLDEIGVSNRLRMLVGETLRIGKSLIEKGGKKMYFAGDIFHVRGSVSPIVLNLVKDMFLELKHIGIQSYLIPGNHDLEGKHTTRLGSAVTALEERGVMVCNELTIEGKVIMVPWNENHEHTVDLLKQAKARLVEDKLNPKNYDAIIHAPINGVFTGIPDTGLDPKALAEIGFRNVFAGHYHNHKQFEGNVWSIGALAHHTWSDVSSKAGYLIVTGGKVQWMKSHLPEFIEIDSSMTEEEVALLAEGNYCKAKTIKTTVKETTELRKWLTGMGAAGVIIQSIKEPTRVREEVVVKSGESVEASIASFVGLMPDLSEENRTEVLKLCQSIYSISASEE